MYSKRQKCDWIGQILPRNCLLIHVIERKTERMIEVRGTRGRRRKQLLEHLQEKGGHWELNEGSTRSQHWRTRFGRDYGPVVRQTTETVQTPIITSAKGEIQWHFAPPFSQYNTHKLQFYK